MGQDAVVRVTVLAGGTGAAKFLSGLRAAEPGAEVTVIGNTADDITLQGLRVCPDLDTVMYTLGGGIHTGQGWGRADESFTVATELAAYGAAVDWFTLGDRDIATHVLRTQLLGHGMALSDVTAILCRRWQPGVTLLPMTDSRVETHVVLPNADGSGETADATIAVHFQEWWVRMHAVPDAVRFTIVGMDTATPAPGVTAAITGADVVVLAPSNPVVSIGPILAVPGIRDALRSTAAPVVGVSPIIDGRAVRGMAESCLRTIGVPATAAGVAGLYADLLDAWLVDHADAAGGGYPEGVRVVPVAALMSDPDAAAALARAALDAAGTRAG